MQTSSSSLHCCCCCWCWHWTMLQSYPGPRPGERPPPPTNGPPAPSNGPPYSGPGEYPPPQPPAPHKGAPPQEHPGSEAHPPPPSKHEGPPAATWTPPAPNRSQHKVDRNKDCILEDIETTSITNYFIDFAYKISLFRGGSYRSWYNPWSRSTCSACQCEWCSLEISSVATKNLTLCSNFRDHHQAQLSSIHQLQRW